jgi:hypothetical protein
MDTPKPRFDTIWDRFEDFEFFEEPVQLCRYAQAFSDWVAQALDVSQDPNVIVVNQAKLLLVDKYFEFYSVVPKRHRKHLGDRGHTCIFQVFLHVYQQLKALELSLTPPMLFLPPPPPPPPQIAGIFIGEER